MSKLTAAADATGVVKTKTTIFDNIIGGATSVLKVASEEDAATVYWSENAMGQVVIGALAGGFLLGDRFGDRVPFLGGRRQ